MLPRLTDLFSAGPIYYKEGTLRCPLRLRGDLVTYVGYRSDLGLLMPFYLCGELQILSSRWHEALDMAVCLLARALERRRAARQNPAFLPSL